MVAVEVASRGGDPAPRVEAAVLTSHASIDRAQLHSRHDRISSRHHLATVCLLGAAAVLLSGCGGTSTESLHGVSLYTTRGPQPGDEALVIGVVALTRGQCVGIEDSDGVVRVAIWPEGTTLADSRPTRITVDGVALAVGDPVRGAGGYYSDDTELATVVATCDAADEVIRIRLE